MTLGYDDIGQPKGIIDLRPLDLSDILDGTIKVYRQSPFIFMGIMAPIVSIPMVVNQSFSLHLNNISQQIMQLTMTGSDPLEPWNSVIDDSFIAFVIVEAIALIFLFFLGPIAQGAVVHAISETILGRPTSIRESLSRVFNAEKAMNVIVAYFLWGLILVGLLIIIYGLLFLGIFMVMPGASGFSTTNTLLAIVAFLGVVALFFVFWFLYVKFLFMPQAVMLDNTSGVGALKRSFNLTTGYWWRIFGLWILITLIIGIIQGLLGQGATLVNLGLGLVKTIPAYIPVATGGVLLTIIYIVTQPLIVIAQTLIYYDLRIRKEGFDLLVLASDMAEDEQGVDLSQDINLNDGADQTGTWHQ